VSVLVIGLISGTSVDGIDAALVEIAGQEMDLQVNLINAHTFDYPPELRSTILEAIAGQPLSFEAVAELDEAIAYNFAQAALAIAQDHKVELIGSHGQTLFHRPPRPGRLGYSLQLGRGALIAHLTGIPTISNFRQADLAAGGQGAPLVSKVDAFLLADPTRDRCIQNIGGIGNVTFLPARQQPAWHRNILGWDTGPGNSLIDLAVQHFSQGEKNYDHQGQWAAQGQICQPLVEQWLEEEFFQQPPPKSTGRELFGQTYLERCLREARIYSLTEADTLATLTELTVASIAHSYKQYLPKQPQQILLCGGGSQNLYLKQRLVIHLNGIEVLTTDEIGVNAASKEALAFAVLAYWRHWQIPGNLPQVTGAVRDVLLGEIHQLD